MNDSKPSHPWTPESLASKEKNLVEIIRENALKKGVADLVAMCDFDLDQRKPPARSRPTTPGALRSNDYVEGYHFVCKNARGVTEDSSGKFRTGSWVVAECNVRTSLKNGAYVALHESRSDASYRQGKLIGYRRTIRDMLADENGGEAKIEEGIEFLVEDTAQPYSWVGKAAGEKGYMRSKPSPSVEQQ